MRKVERLLKLRQVAALQGALSRPTNCLSRLKIAVCAGVGYAKGGGASQIILPRFSACADNHRRSRQNRIGSVIQPQTVCLETATVWPANVRLANGATPHMGYA